MENSIFLTGYESEFFLNLDRKSEIYKFNPKKLIISTIYDSLELLENKETFVAGKDNKLILIKLFLDKRDYSADCKIFKTLKERSSEDKLIFRLELNNKEYGEILSVQPRYFLLKQELNKGRTANIENIFLSGLDILNSLVALTKDGFKINKSVNPEEAVRIIKNRKFRIEDFLEAVENKKPKEESKSRLNIYFGEGI